MMKIKGVSTIKWKCYDKKRIIDKYKKGKDKVICKNEEQKVIKGVNCFALVPVIRLPWYKKLAKKIRNYIIVYRWRKAR